MKLLGTFDGHEYEIMHWPGTGTCPIKVREEWSLPQEEETLQRIKKSLKDDGQNDPIEMNADREIVDGMTRFRLLKELGKGVDYVVLEHIRGDKASWEYALKKQWTRRNLSKEDRQRILARAVRNRSRPIPNSREDGGDADDQEGLARNDPALPIVTSDKILKETAAKHGVSTNTVKRAVKAANEGLLDEAPKNKAKPPKKKAPRKVKEPDPLDQFLLRMKGLMKSIDKIIEVIDEYRETDFGKNPKELDAVIAGLNKGRMAIGNLHDKHRKRKRA